MKTARQGRSYYGERDGQRLVEWLNNKPEEKTERLRTLWQAIQDLPGKIKAALDFPARKRRRKSVFEKAKLPGAKAVADSIVKEEALAEAHEGVNGILAQYRLTPFVIPSPNSSAQERPQIIWNKTEGESLSEALMLQTLLKLWQQGLLARVRRCKRPECGRWFFARFKHQLFDSTPCQQQFYSSDPAFKKKRRESLRQTRLRLGY